MQLENEEQHYSSQALNKSFRIQVLNILNQQTYLVFKNFTTVYKLEAKICLDQLFHFLNRMESFLIFQNWLHLCSISYQ